MAKSPAELLLLTNDDVKAVEAIEKIIDASPVFNTYDGSPVTVVIPKAEWIKHFTVRMVIRRSELTTRYRNAGWKQVEVYGPGLHGKVDGWIKLDQHAPQTHPSPKD